MISRCRSSNCLKTYDFSISYAANGDHIKHTPPTSPSRSEGSSSSGVWIKNPLMDHRQSHQITRAAPTWRNSPISPLRPKAINRDCARSLGEHDELDRFSAHRALHSYSGGLTLLIRYYGQFDQKLRDATSPPACANLPRGDHGRA